MKRNIFSRLFAWVLTLCMVLTLLPAMSLTAQAATAGATASTDKKLSDYSNGATLFAEAGWGFQSGYVIDMTAVKNAISEYPSTYKEGTIWLNGSKITDSTTMAVLTYGGYQRFFYWFDYLDQHTIVNISSSDEKFKGKFDVIAACAANSAAGLIGCPQSVSDLKVTSDGYIYFPFYLPYGTQEGQTLNIFFSANGFTNGFPSDGSALQLDMDKLMVTIPELPVLGEGANGSYSVASGSTAINGGEKLDAGTTLTVTATPNEGSEVTGWNYNGTVQSGTATSVEVTVAEDMVIPTPVFSAKKYASTLSGDGLTGTMPQAIYGTAYSATLAVADGWSYPDSITVTVGGTALSEGDFTYNAATGELTVNAGKVTGEIAITGSATLDWYDDTKNENENKENLEALLNKSADNVTKDDLDTIAAMCTSWGSLGDTEKTYVATKLNNTSFATAQEITTHLNSLKAAADAIILADAKTNAKGDIDAEAAKAKATINALPNLSETEKATLCAAVDTAAQTAKSNIDAATNTDGVTTAKSNGIAAINEQVAAAQAADAANKFVADHLTDMTDNSIITEATDDNYAQILGGKTDWDALSEAAKNAVNAKLTKAAGKELTYPELLTAAQAKKDAADAADFIAKHLTKDNAVITKATDDNYAQILGGETDWNALSPEAQAVVNAKLTEANSGTSLTYPDLLAAAKKQDAQADIDAAAAAAKEAIDKLDNLSDTEKAELKNKVDTEAAAAKTNIQNATDADVTTKMNAGIAAINLISSKADAIDAVKQAAKDEKAAIAALSDLTAEEKTAKQTAVDTAADAAIEAINKAETNSTEAVATAKDAGLAAIGLIGDKAALKDELIRDAQEKTAAINAMENLTDAEKTALTDAIADNLAAALIAIDDAADVTAAEAAAAKAKAVDAIKAAEAAALDAVAALDALDDSEKAAYAEKISDAAAAAIAKVATAADQDALDDIVEAVIAEMTDSVDDATAADFVKAYVTGQDDAVYTAVDTDNVDQILSGQTPWAAMTAAQQAKANALIAAANQNITGAPQSYEEFVAAGEAFADASADAFIKTYLTGADGAIYKEATAGNYEQILSGKDAWNAMSKAEQDAVNAKLTANGGKTYPELLAQAETIEKNAIAFVETYLTGKNGKIYKEVTAGNYAQILSGKAQWDKMTEKEQAAVNAILLENGGKTYPELLKLAEAAHGFIDKYVSDKDGDIHKKATSRNYKQILSGEHTWNKLSRTERDLINSILTANGGKTYPALLDLAADLKAESGPETGDVNNMAVWIALFLAAAVCAVAVILPKRKKGKFLD